MPEKHLQQKEETENQLNENKKTHQNELIKIEKYLNHPIFHIKHITCTHPHGCLTKIIKLSLNGLLSGMAVKALVGLLSTLLRQKLKIVKNPHLLITCLLNKEVVKFGIFPMIYNMLLQLMTCNFRHLNILNEGKTQRSIQSFLAGFIAGGLSLMTKEKKSRGLWALFLVSRSFDFIINSLVQRKIIPKCQYNWIFIFQVLWTLIATNPMYEVGNMPPSLLKFYNSFSMKDVSEINFFTNLMYHKNRELYINHGAKPQNPRKVLSYPRLLIDVFGHYKKYTKEQLSKAQ